MPPIAARIFSRCRLAAMRHLRFALFVLLATIPLAGRAARTAQPPAESAVEPDRLQGLLYRMIGPHRGGRVTAVTGVPSEHGVVYMGSSGGGVWKSSGYGEVWENLFD